MRNLLLTIALGLAAAAPAAAAPARVDVAIIGSDMKPAAARTVTLKARDAKAGSRRCRVGARTALSALLGTSRTLRLRDHGSCSRRPADAGGLYVVSIGADRERGRSGWVYKVGRRLGTAGAADPGGPFGSGGLRDRQRVTWFWCTLDAKGACERTLEGSARKEGDGFRVTVRGYDDEGRGVLVAGATVRLGSSVATSGADGTALVAASGTLTVEKPGMIPSVKRSL